MSCHVGDVCDTCFCRLQLPLPVKESDSLAQKVEALRVFLEQALGTGPFLKLYRHMESSTPEPCGQADPEDLCARLGYSHVHYVPLVHQLIVSEELMHADASTDLDACGANV